MLQICYWTRGCVFLLFGHKKSVGTSITLSRLFVWKGNLSLKSRAHQNCSNLATRCDLYYEDQEMKWVSLYVIEDNNDLNSVPTVQKTEVRTPVIDGMMYEMYHSSEDDERSDVGPCKSILWNWNILIFCLTILMSKGRFRGGRGDHETVFVMPQKGKGWVGVTQCHNVWQGER